MQTSIKTHIVILCLLTLLTSISVAQSSNTVKRTVGLTYSTLGGNNVVNNTHSTMAGEASYYGNGFFTIGLAYIQPLSKWLDIETGIEFSKHTFTVEPMSIPGTNYDFSPYEKDIQLLNIPVTVRINFFKYFFVNGGFMLDLETGTKSPVDSQTGIGSLMGIGGKYSLNNGIGIFANWYNKYHALVAIGTENSEHRWKLLEGGMRFGVTYNFR